MDKNLAWIAALKKTAAEHGWEIMPGATTGKFSARVKLALGELWFDARYSGIKQTVRVQNNGRGRNIPVREARGILATHDGAKA